MNSVDATPAEITRTISEAMLLIEALEKDILKCARADNWYIPENVRDMPQRKTANG